MGSSGLLKQIALLTVALTLLFSATKVFAEADRSIRAGVQHNLPMIDYDDQGQGVRGFADLPSDVPEREGHTLPPWLLPTLGIMGIALVVLGFALLGRIHLRKGLRQLSRKNQLLEKEIAERRRAREALQWELKVNRAIAELSRLLLHFSSMEEISHVILEEAKELTDSPHGFVGFIDPRTGAMVSPTMTPEVWDDYAREQAADKRVVFQTFRGLWGWVLSHRQPILCNDPETDHRSTGTPLGHMAISRFIGAPAMADEKLLGIIALANSERDYHAKDLELLERLASMYALAVQNMRSAQAIRESEERFRAIFEHAGVGMATIDPDGRYLQVNPAYCRLAGYTPDEFLKLTVEDITHPDDLAMTRGLYDDVRQGRKRFFSYEKRFIHKNGQVVWVLVTVAWLLDEEGNPTYAIAQVQDVTERKAAEIRLLENEERFKYLAHHDNLTGLPNRLLFTDRLQHALSKARRGGHLLALLFFDLDRFKAINDAYGHEAGDLVLQTVGNRLQSLVREADTVARFGGDEFIVLLEDIQDIESVKNLAGKILSALANPLQIENETFIITSSIGISLFPADGTDGEMLIKKADDAMFRAKEKGRNLFLFYDSGDELPSSIVDPPPEFEHLR